MSDTVISVENVSKAYRLGQIGGGTLKEDFARYWAKLRGKPDPFLKIGEEHHARHMGEQFWALDDVSFEVKQGEVLGIIGRNGAGKSTLLKILSQVTTPTSGQIKIKGRIASLLEVGTGFNPEMTGRENVFLNGAILGMTKAEIRKKFDEIVAFSEIEEFIDTPVKRYSSGMYVRLAFAVAAHLEPEILICDEVLAVGDQQFQDKCIGKMQDVSKGGRTVLFVSHNTHAVQQLCSRALLFENGRLSFKGKVDAAINLYMGDQDTKESHKRQTPANSDVRVTSWLLSAARSELPHCCLSRENCQFVFEVETKRPLQKAQFGFVMRNESGDLLISVNSRDNGHNYATLPVGRHNISVSLCMPFRAGRYQVEFAIADESFKMLDHWQAKPLLTILPCDQSVLTEEWKGLINEPALFEIMK
jgi:homopolymeric O-antigen transport system ATP-binding protein